MLVFSNKCSKIIKFSGNFKVVKINTQQKDKFQIKTKIDEVRYQKEEIILC